MIRDEIWSALKARDWDSSSSPKSPRREGYSFLTPPATFSVWKASLERILIQGIRRQELLEENHQLWQILKERDKEIEELKELSAWRW